MSNAALLWHNGRIKPWAEANVHVSTHALHYGSSVFEGERLYATPNGPAYFRLADHTRRLFESARIYEIDIGYSEAEIDAACHEVIRANGMQSAYVRPIVFRGAGGLGVLPRDGAPVEVAIMAMAWGAYLGEAAERGADVCVSSWNRPAPNTIPSWAKAGGNYLSSQLIGLEARRGGYDEGIALGHNGLLSEGAGENLFLVKRGKLITPPSSAGILAGITRDSVLTLAAELGIEAEERELPREALYTADEIFMTGTAAEITPVRSVDRKPVGNGQPGPITCALREAFFGLFDGRTHDKWGWLDVVDSRSSAASLSQEVTSAVVHDQAHNDPSLNSSADERAKNNFGSLGMTARTLFEKIWDAHVVVPETADTPAILYVDLHLVHEVTSPQAFDELRSRGLKLRRTDRTLATLDHSTPTLPAGTDGERPYASAEAKAQVAQLEKNCREFGVELHGWDSSERGIVHVIGPELGATQPGNTIVCGDSHTSTHGAFGALAFGIGTTEVGHVLATQCLLQRKPKTLAIHVDGELPKGVGAKDLILHIIGTIGVDGGTGHVIEYRGAAIEKLSMEERMTVCNMSIEAGARAGLIAPDETTFAWLKGRPRVPQGEAWERAVAHWRTLKTDAGARYDREVRIDASTVKPTVTYGTHPGMAIAMDAPVPAARNAVEQRALDYMRSRSGQPMQGTKVDVVFVGSCTNSRLSDLREAASVLRGRRVADGVRMLVVPGSEAVRRAAEAEGLHDVFLTAGAEWRIPGCSMCIAMNGDLAQPGQLVVSTSNRNFEGRQGKGARTVLASPATAAASAVAGTIADPRDYMNQEQAA